MQNILHSIRARSPLAALALVFSVLPVVLAQQPAPAPATPPPAQEPEQQAEPQSSASPVRSSFLFELQGHGAKAYLFGTVHLPDKRIVDLPEVVTRAFDAADVVLTEIETTLAAEMTVAKASMLPRGTTLAELLGADDMQRVRARLEAAGLPTGTLDRFQPWAAATMLPMLPILPQMMKNPPLDKLLYERAKKAGKTVAGLETVAEQIGVFEGLTQEEQTGMLRSTLDQLERHDAAGRDGIEEMVQAWLTGDHSRLLDLLDEGLGEDEELSRKLEDRLIWERNVRLAQRMDERIQNAPDKVHFFAIGALHLPDGRLPEDMPLEGDAADTERARLRGTLSLLQARGYRTVRVTKLEAAPLEKAK